MSNEPTTYERSEDGDHWEVVTESNVRERLTGYYYDVGLVFEYMADGGIARTPYAQYRNKTATDALEGA